MNRGADGPMRAGPMRAGAVRVGAALAGAALTGAVLALAIFVHFSLTPVRGVAEVTVRSAIEAALARVCDRSDPPPSAPLDRDVTIRAISFVDGQQRQAATVTARRLDRGIVQALSALDREVVCRGRGAVEVHVERGRGPVLARPPWANLSFVEGVDGLSVHCSDDTRAQLLSGPELLREGFLSSYQPLKKIEPGFRVGLALDRIAEQFCSDQPLLGLERIRFVSFVRTNAKLRRLRRAHLWRPHITRDDIRAAVVHGVDYLLRHQNNRGRFTYVLRPFAPPRRSKRYSWTRHAGVAYSLALSGRLLDDERALDGAARALRAMTRRLTKAEGGRCFRAGKKCYVGTSAILLLALAEYHAARGPSSLDAAAAQVAGFLRAMQRPRGDFFHFWSQDKGIDRQRMLPYATAQAALALARFGRILDDEKALAAARTALDHLAGAYWDFFLGRYFVAQEHWTCLAAEEFSHVDRAHPARRFCVDIANFYARLMLHPSDTPRPDEVGGVGISHVVTPYVGPTATVVEALVSGAILENDHAREREPTAIEAALVEGVRFLVRSQFTAEDTYAMAAGARAQGGFPDAASKPSIRMDNVQHAISGLVRALPLLDETGAMAR